VGVLRDYGPQFPPFLNRQLVAVRTSQYFCQRHIYVLFHLKKFTILQLYFSSFLSFIWATVYCAEYRVSLWLSNFYIISVTQRSSNARNFYVTSYAFMHSFCLRMFTVV